MRRATSTRSAASDTGSSRTEPPRPAETMSGIPALVLSAVLGGVAVLLVLRGRIRREEERRKSAEDELARERSSRAEAEAAVEARQEALFENMVEGVLLLDEGGRVLFTNTACRLFFGLHSDLRGRSLLETFRCVELADVAAEAGRAQSVTGREIELSGSGEERSLQVNAARIVTPDGRLTGTLLVLHDTTRLRQLESTRREFVANVSHELRTPLSLIKGSVETLLDGAVQDPGTASRFLEIIDRHCDRLTFLIEDLLTLSRLESGQVAINFDTVPLRRQVAEVVDDFTRKANDRGVDLVNAVPPELRARADSDRLDQVLANLVDNAIKYGRPGGSVRVEGRNIPDAGRVELAVVDDGPGIPTEAAERVFERFYRVDTARSREQGGTGLGLSIVKHIVQAHGGEVRLETAIGKGSTFRFTLPAAEPETSVS
jgi:two-component system, OmpR family, phosphate regulon sensor histidine kinase PhoR